MDFGYLFLGMMENYENTLQSQKEYNRNYPLLRNRQPGGAAGRDQWLPEEINGLPVVSAAPYAFSAHKDGEEDAETWESEDVISFGEERLLAGEEVQEIVFPDTLKEIGRYIFYGCKKLERLEFSDTLMQVGTGAFTGCSGLKELVIHQKKGNQILRKGNPWGTVAEDRCGFSV